MSTRPTCWNAADPDWIASDSGCSCDICFYAKASFWDDGYREALSDLEQRLDDLAQHSETVDIVRELLFAQHRVLDSKLNKTR